MRRTSGRRAELTSSEPNRIKDAGGIPSQFHHLIDIVPTILDVTGIPTTRTSKRRIRLDW